MKKGFYTIMAAQFFSSLADNALLIAAIAQLNDLNAPQWMTPLLKLFFVLAYVMLAAFVGAFADSMSKRHVMLITNTIKVAGCMTMLAGAHPLLAYSIVGLGAAAYSPAKYGILTELLPPERLVAANGWIEGTTVGSIILGTLLGGMLISPSTAQLSIHLGFLADASPAKVAICVTILIYLIAALFNLGIPETGAHYPRQQYCPFKLISHFTNCLLALWRDPLGQISLAVTTLFWGAGATLQFIVLKWAELSLGRSLSESTVLQAVVALGMAVGATAAAQKIPLKRSLSVLPIGILMGLVVVLMAFYTRDSLPLDWGIAIGRVWLPGYLLIAYLLLTVIGVLAGFFIVPMNALLQHRGHVLLSAGHSIAVQNFNENLSMLLMLCLYAMLIWLDIPLSTVIMLFGLFVCLMMGIVIKKHQANQRQFDSVALIGKSKH